MPPPLPAMKEILVVRGGGQGSCSVGGVDPDRSIRSTLQQAVAHCGETRSVVRKVEMVVHTYELDITKGFVAGMRRLSMRKFRQKAGGG